MRRAPPAALWTALTGAALAAAAPAHAELPDHIASAVKVCLDDTSFDARVSALSEQDWRPITEAEAPEASLALAPYKMIFVFMHGYDGVWNPVESQERLMRIAERDAALLATQSDSAAVMVNPAGGTLEIYSSGPDGVSVACNLAAPGAVESDLGDILGVTLSQLSYPLPVRIFDMPDETPSPRYVSFLTFAPAAFATHEPAPIIVVQSPEAGAP